MRSPFRFGKIVSGEWFTNRRLELQRLKSNFRNDINTMLISPRRWGKSSLVQRAAVDYSFSDEDTKVVFLDLFTIRDEEEFCRAYAAAALKASVNRIDELLSDIKSFLTRINPKFSFGADPMNDLQLGFELGRAQEDIMEILNLPEKIAKKKKIKFLICIDEFQNLGNFRDPELFQKRLRSSWQRHKSVTYCLYGSKRHMLMNLFEKKSMPFYKFGDVIYLDKISAEDFTEFIIKAFQRTGKAIDKIYAIKIINKVQRHPYYVQQLAHLVWINTMREVDSEIIESAVEDLLNQNSMLYQKETDYLSNTQINFLKALTDRVGQFSAAPTLREYNLGTSGNVVKIKKALEKKEIIDTLDDKIQFLDPVYELWFRRDYLRYKD